MGAERAALGHLIWPPSGTPRERPCGSAKARLAKPRASPGRYLCAADATGRAVSAPSQRSVLGDCASGSRTRRVLAEFHSVPVVVEDLAVDWAMSARPQHVDDKVEVPPPVEIGSGAHRRADAAHQHPDVRCLHVEADRPGAPRAFDQLCRERDQLILLGLSRASRTARRRSPARTGSRHRWRRSLRYVA